MNTDIEDIAVALGDTEAVEIAADTVCNKG